MEILGIIFGIVGVISFLFSIYSHFKNESKKAIEAAKNATHIERIRNAKDSLGGLYNTIDMIVQLPKKGNVTVAQLQDMARIARNRALVIARQLEMEENQLRDWKYGELFFSIKEDLKRGKNGN